MDLFGNEFTISDPKPKQTGKSSKKKTTNPAQFTLGEDISFAATSLYGEEFEIKDKEIDVDKALKSKSLTLLERLAIINEKVLSVLGKQKDNVMVIKTREQLHDYITKCIEAGRIDIDTETNNSLDPVTCKLMGPCFYAPGLKQAYVPLNHRDPITKERLSWQLTEQDIKEELERVMLAKRDNLLKMGITSDYEGQSFDEWCNKHSDVVFNAAPLIVMHNGKFDYEVIYCTCGIKVRPDWDTMIGARLLNENELASLKDQYTTKIDPSQAKYKIDKLFENVQYADVDPEIFALYAATDSMMTDELFLYQLPIFSMPENDKLFNFLFKKIEMPIVIVTAEMEMRGVCIDTTFGEKLKAKYNQQLADTDAAIANELNNLKDVIMQWKLSPEANEKVRIYPAKKTKMSADKIEKTFNLIDEDGKRYKLGKAKIDILEEPINLGSSAQLAVLFYDILKCEAVNKDKERGAGKDELDKLGKALAKYSLDKQLTLELSDDELDEAFENWSNDEHTDDDEDINEDVNDLFVHKAAARLCELILKRRGIVKLVSTYIDVIPDLVKHWPDGRIRFHLNSMGTDTGRYSSGGKLKFMENEEAVEVSGINIQNIPSHNKEIRMLFRAKQDKAELEISEGNYYELKEISEIETANGWKLGKDLVIGDKLPTNEGTVDVIKSIVYKDRTYLLYV